MIWHIINVNERSVIPRIKITSGMGSINLRRPLKKSIPTNPGFNPGYIQWDSILSGRATRVNLLYIPLQPIMG